MLLSESVTVGDINSAIDNHERIIVNYHSEGKDEFTGPRLIEVYTYELTKAGNPAIRTFQYVGDSRSGIVPSWKLMRLDRISSWKPTGQTFDQPADGFHKGLGDFNPNGDDTMRVVFKVAKFGNEDSSQSGLVTKDGGIFRTDSEKRMSRLRHQLDNPIYLSDFQDEKGRPKREKIPTPTSGPVTKQAPEKKDDVFKTDTEKRMERLRQQLDKPQYLDGFRDNNTKEIEDLRKKLGDTSEPITVSDLEQRLASKPEEAEKEKDDIFKTDTERKMERLKQQLNNPQKIDLSKIPKR